MKTLLSKTIACVATTTALSVVMAHQAPQADAATFNLSWKGTQAGYSLKGVLSFDETQIPPGSIVTKNTPGFNLDLSFFSPSNHLLGTYIANQTTYPDFNFNFDLSTHQVLQSEKFSSPKGFDIGTFPPSIGNQDFNLYTTSGSDFLLTGTIRLCSGDENCDSDSEMGEGGIVDQGGRLVATAVPDPNSTSIPEPNSILSLLLFGTLGAGLALKRQKV